MPFVFLVLLMITVPLARAEIRLGIIGTDTSHATAFARVLNDPTAPDHLQGAHIVAAWKGGSADIKESAGRVDQFAKELKDKWNVKIVGSIADLCPAVDGLLLESVDRSSSPGTISRSKPMRQAGFIDKPLASTFADAKAIALSRMNEISHGSVRLLPCALAP